MLTTLNALVTATASSASSASARDKTSSSSSSSSSSTRRALMFRSVASPLVLGSVLNLGASTDAPRLGLTSFNGVNTGLTLCPTNSQNCVGTADEFNDASRYIPAWVYNDEEAVARGKAAVDVAQAMDTLVEVINTTDCDGYEAKIVARTDDYLRAEYTSPFFGFVDDVEFYFPAGQKSRVEYRSASRVGESDFDANRKRIKTLRLALQKKGWRSVGFS